jgi:hypothetical protein
MSRLSLLVASAALGLAAVGCAHCDTCDDFPAPCNGPNCGMTSGYGMSGPQTAPTTAAPAQPPAAGAAAAPTTPSETPAAPGATTTSPPADAAPGTTQP